MHDLDFTLLKKLQTINSTSGDEYLMKDFLIDFIKKNMNSWKNKPELIYGKDFQDCLILKFGKPRTAVYAHMDSVGFTVRYNNELIKIGGAKIINKTELVGNDSKGNISTYLYYDDKTSKIFCDYKRNIDVGTNLVFKPNFNESNNFIKNCYMDNRLGIFNVLELAKTLDNGIIVFTCWEEIGGGSVGYLSKYLYEKYKINQALISDITWITEGIKHNNGVVISIRDSSIPRRIFVNKIINIASKSNIKFQLEVESSGGSDGNSIQRAPYPINWCFVGAPEDNVHSPYEKVHKNDIKSMIQLYQKLMINL